MTVYAQVFAHPEGSRCLSAFGPRINQSPGLCPPGRRSVFTAQPIRAQGHTFVEKSVVAINLNKHNPGLALPPTRLLYGHY